MAMSVPRMIWPAAILRKGRGLSCWRGGVSGRKVVDKAASDAELRVFVVAGEVSGDSIASRLMSALKRLSPYPVRFAGVGGASMHKEGLKSLFPMEDISVMGICELLPHLYRINEKLKETIDAAFCFQPHVVVTVDAKGFSFRFLKRLRARCNQRGGDNPTHVHYVAPSFWAWKGGEKRLKELSGFIDLVLCILPFEEEICEKHRLMSTFVGHPVLEDAINSNQGSDCYDEIILRGNSERFRRKHAINDGATIFALLPGSRLQEVSRMLPIFLKAMDILQNYFHELKVIILTAPHRDVEAYVTEIVHKGSISAIFIPGDSLPDKYDAFAASSAALCTSGTAVLELQLARLPSVVAYRAHFLTELIIKYRTRLQYMSLPNIILDTEAIPEALFQACTPNNLAKLLLKVVNDADCREKQVAAAETVLKILCPPAVDVDDLVQDERKRCFGSHTSSNFAAAMILYSEIK